MCALITFVDYQFDKVWTETSFRTEVCVGYSYRSNLCGLYILLLLLTYVFNHHKISNANFLEKSMKFGSFVNNEVKITILDVFSRFDKVFCTVHNIIIFGYNIAGRRV